MPFLLKNTNLGSMAVVQAVSQTLRRIDPRLVDHGERVAFLADELRLEGNLTLDTKTLFLLSVFHDIGAYKTDEIDHMVEFETGDVFNHSRYGYLFLKHLTPLREASEAILYHHTPENELGSCSRAFVDYASLIHLVDRVDVLSNSATAAQAQKRLAQAPPDLFREDYLTLLDTCIKKRRLFERLADGSYREDLRARVEGFSLDANEALEYLKMIVYSIDFRSECTVTHSVNTASLSLELARACNFNQTEQEEVLLGAMLHDVGKITIPLEILEKPGRLTPEEMSIMKTHVSETESLIAGILPEKIVNIAARHHEKLDGSGYPYGLAASDLSIAERIVAVADIASALASRRSYKEPFPREKTQEVITQMQGTQLDTYLCAYLCDHYDEIMATTEEARLRVIQKYQHIREELEELEALDGSFVRRAATSPHR